MNCGLFRRLADEYLRGRMEECHIEAFEEHYFVCEACALELNLRDRLAGSAVWSGVEKNRQKPQRHARRWLPMAAALLGGGVLLAVVMWVYLPLNRENGREWLAKLIQREIPVYIVSEARSAGIAGNAAFDSAMEYYSQRNYAGALSILESLASDGVNPQIIFFRGICYLQTEQPSSASREFERLLKIGNVSYRDDALFFNTLALLRIGKDAEALNLLKELTAQRGPYAMKADELLVRIRGH